MKNSLEGNIVKYCIYKIFTKRVYLPLIAIFLIDHCNVTLTQIALIASITSIATIILEIPSGYIADRCGHKETLVLAPYYALSYGHFSVHSFSRICPHSSNYL